jgi:hypothetical protein
VTSSVNGIPAGAGKLPEIPDAPLRFDVGRSLDPSLAHSADVVSARSATDLGDWFEVPREPKSQAFRPWWLERARRAKSAATERLRDSGPHINSAWTVHLPPAKVCYSAAPPSFPPRFRGARIPRVAWTDRTYS